jgi:hypothetical protein
MHAAVPVIPDRAPRRARYLIPRDTPRRAEVLAVLTIVIALASLLFAPLTAALAAAFHVVGKLSRWRPVWLAAPAAGGLIWVLAVGPDTALAGFGEAPAAVTALLSRAVTDPATVGRLGILPAVVARGLAAEFPLALVLAPVLAAFGWWLSRLHTSEWDMAAPRPGLASLCRRRRTAALVRSGRLVTRDGTCLGPDIATGGPVNVTWREAGGGVLVTGASWDEVSASSLQFAHAAIRRRTPVIVFDLAAGSGLAAEIAAICASADAPLHVFGPRGPGCYDPFRDRGPATAADLVIAMLGRALPEPARPAARSCLTAVFTVVSAVPGEGPGAALDEVVSLLRPGACRAAVERLPGLHPGRAALAESLRAAARWLESDQACGSLIVEQLTAVRASAAGQWLVPAPLAAESSLVSGISPSEVIRDRSVALFSLGQDTFGQAAPMIANLVAADTAAVCAGLRRDGAMGDVLALVSPCDPVDPGALRAILRCGAACVLATPSPDVAGVLAEQVSVRVVHRLADQQLAGRLAPLAGARWLPAVRAAAPPEWPATGEFGSSPAHAGPGSADGGRGALPLGVIKAPRMAAESFCRLGDSEFSLIVGWGERVVARGLAVPGRLAGLGSGRGRPR